MTALHTRAKGSLEEGHPQKQDKKELSDKVNDKAHMPFSFCFAPLEGLKEGKVFHIAGTFFPKISFSHKRHQYI